MQRCRQLSQLSMHRNKHDLLSYAEHAHYGSETHVKRRGVIFSLRKFLLFLRELTTKRGCTKAGKWRLMMKKTGLAKQININIRT